jgi:hypothetical protein
MFVWRMTRILVIGWGTRIRTSVNGARTRRPAARRSPSNNDPILGMISRFCQGYFI